ncbi:MAG: dephospho-CoA kinase [bacterium]|nr:dephospho-CoA kinase [bacterium]
MHSVVLGGGIASGKSLASELLMEMGATVADLDYIARDVRNRPAMKAKLGERFGSQIFDEEGCLDTKKLAEAAFKTPEDTEALNAILHPTIAETAFAVMRNYGEMPAKGVFIMQVPLLDKSVDLNEMADEVLLISAPAQLRLERAIARGMTAEDAKARIEAQASDEELRAIADTVIENVGTEDELWEKLSQWYRDRMEAQIR